MPISDRIFKNNQKNGSDTGHTNGQGAILPA